MMAQWRTAFNMTQDEVAGLADKINYLGNTGPANAKKISDIVTRIGPLGGVAGVASGEIAAMGATIAGMGVESEIAATGSRTSCFPLTAGNSATKSQKQALRFLRINPKKLAADMQKDAREPCCLYWMRWLKCLKKTGSCAECPVRERVSGRDSTSAD